MHMVSRKAGVKTLSSTVHSKSPSIFIKLIDKNEQINFEISVYVTKSQCVDLLKFWAYISVKQCLCTILMRSKNCGVLIPPH